jgi:hypothetical protein
LVKDFTFSSLTLKLTFMPRKITAVNAPFKTISCAKEVVTKRFTGGDAQIYG